jgi:hypothetical protein
MSDTLRLRYPNPELGWGETEQKEGVDLTAEEKKVSCGLSLRDQEGCRVQVWVAWMALQIQWYLEHLMSSNTEHSAAWGSRLQREKQYAIPTPVLSVYSL